MLPGKKYTPEDFLRIAWARKWFIVVPTALIAAGAVAWSYSLPNRYQASTTIQVTPPRVPVSYVRTTVTGGVSERLRTISQLILSRTRLERIIEEFNLYPVERQTLIMEDVIEQMREDISVNIPTARRNRGGGSTFKISFSSAQPRVAMQVTERLASLFVQENLEARELQAEATSQFLQAQLEEARRRLTEYEAKLADFRRRNMGQMPTQMQSNLQMMQNAQARLLANAEAVTRERERLATLEASIVETAAAGAAVTPSGAGDLATSSGGTAAQRLEAARAALRNLELRLKPDHPDIRRAHRLIAELEAKAEGEALAVAVSPETASQPRTAADKKLAEMRRQAQELRSGIDKRKQDEARLQAVLASYTTKVEGGPSIESALTDLMRDYSTIRASYTSLLQKSEEAQMAVNLERRQIGEQFKILEGVRLPERPTSPDRVRINLMGLAGGLGLGLALVALLTYRDTTLKTDEDVVISLALPVLAVIPVMITTAERQRMKRRRTALALSASVASILLVAAVVAWKLQLIQDWVR